MRFNEFKNIEDYDRKIFKITNLSDSIKKGLKIDKLDEPFYGVLYVDYECGITCRIYRNNTIYIKDELLLIRKNNFEDLNFDKFENLNENDKEVLNQINNSYYDEVLSELLEDKRLNKFRHEDFLYDVQVLLPTEKGLEQMWCRLVNKTSNENLYIGKLLNNSYVNKNFHEGITVVFEYILDEDRNDGLIINGIATFDNEEDCEDISTKDKFLNAKRIKTKKDWIDILDAEEQEDNIILEILFYMFDCKDYTSNGLNILKALQTKGIKINGIPNSQIASFGRRIIKLKGIPEQKRENNQNRYWNIPFETDFSKNNKIFTWKLRKELVEALIEKYNLVKEEKITAENQFLEHLEMLPVEEYENRIKSEIDIRNNFVERFNINYITNMELEDYVTGRSTIDERGKNAFCYVMESKMMQLGDMRGATADKFGIYFSKDENKYKPAKKYGDSIEMAFKNIKEEICKLIVAGNNEDYDIMKNSSLPPLFKGKILSTYFPEKYLCIFKEEDIDKFLYLLEVNYDVNEIDTIEKKKKILKEYKDGHKLFRTVSDYYFVIFLYNTYKKELKIKNTVNGKINNNLQFVSFNYLGKHETIEKQTYRSRGTDYEKINRNKKDIGDRGERVILEYEKLKLEKLGLYELAEKVSLTENDAIGYDIDSFDENGNEIHIEVKTNSGSNNNLVEFYITNKELKTLLEDSSYNIYYLYSIKNKPKVHIINKNEILKDMDKYLSPILYKVSIAVEKVD